MKSHAFGMVRLPLGVQMRFRFAVLMFVLMFAAGLHADIVKLAGGRMLRVVAVSTHGAETTLTLTAGGTMNVPASSIESVEPELIAAGVCAASPYRCQDRSMLMMRSARATHAAPQPQAAH